MNNLNNQSCYHKILTWTSMLIFIMMSFISFASIPVEVKVAGEPIVKKIRRAATQFSNVDQSGVEWNDLANLNKSDNQYASLVLLPGAYSDLLKGNALNIYVPEYSEIFGFELRIEGHIEGGGYIEDTAIHLSGNSGSIKGDNKKNQALYGQEWKHGSETNDFNWSYGYRFDKWGTTWEPNELNNEDFGYQIGIKNPSEDTMTIRIDRIDIRVYYLPPASFCLADCMTFYVDPYNEGKAYEWYIPDGFNVISDSDLNTISIYPTTASFGRFEICAQITDQDDSVSNGCMYFVYKDCSPSNIGDFVWNDANKNGIQDLGEEGVAGAQLSLYDENDDLIIETTSNGDGQYQFDAIPEGYYYVKLQTIANMELTISNATIDSLDSDLIEVFGAWRTVVFYHEASVNRYNVDFGLVFFSGDISGTTWIDQDVSGVIDSFELVFPEVQVSLFQANVLIASTNTDSLGNYIFKDVIVGDYYLVFEAEDYGFSPAFQGSDILVDSDVTGNNGTGSTNTIVVGNQDIYGINAGMYYLRHDIKGVCWIDTDQDGITSLDESGLSGVAVTLFHDNVLVENTTTDSLGNYIFEAIYADDYYIVFEAEDYGYTIAFQGSNILLDSDVTEANGAGSTDVFTLSNKDVEGINGGMIYLRHDIKGVCWDDTDQNGVITADEFGLSDVIVQLYQNDVLMENTTTDSLGNYIFESIYIGDYYIVFEAENYGYTLAYQGSDILLDSDVTEANGAGSTDLFTLSNQDLEGINAGLIYLRRDIKGVCWDDTDQDGVITADEFGLSDVVVQLYQNGVLMESTTTDSLGNYIFESIYIGDYYIIFEAEDYGYTLAYQGSDILLDSDVTGANGDGSTDLFTLSLQDLEGINAGMIYLRRAFKGVCWIDTNQDGVITVDEPGLSDVVVQLYQNGVLMESTTTDSLGNYSFENIIAGDYYIYFDIAGFEFTAAFQGTDILLDSDVTDSFGSGTTNLLTIWGQDINGINAGLINTKSSISGIVWKDDNENGVYDIEEELQKETFVVLKSGNTLAGSIITDSLGRYSFNDILPGDYYVLFALANHGFTTAFVGVDTLIDSDVTGLNGTGSTNTYSLYKNDLKGINAGLVSALGKILGTIWHDLDADGIETEIVGIEGVEVEIHHDLFGLLGITYTDEQGDYLFENLIDGDYQVKFKLIGDYNLTYYQVGSDTDINSDFQLDTDDYVSSDIYGITNFVHIQNIDGGLYNNGSIGDYAWNDDNGNGIQDIAENGLLGVGVVLANLAGDIVQDTITDINGHYRFDNIRPGKYGVGYLVQAEYNYTIPNVGTNDSIDSDVILIQDLIGVTDTIELLSGEQNYTIDVGIIFESDETNDISGIIWEDLDANGVIDLDEPGIDGIWVYLYSSDGSLLDSVQSSANTIIGTYAFNDLDLGDYYIEFTLDSLGSLSDPFQGSNTDIDADVTGANGIYTTDTLSIEGTNINRGVNAGVYNLASISGYVWKDLNSNNINDELDKGFNEIIVKLYDTNGVELNFVVTSNDEVQIPGYYEFENVKPGDYYILFNNPENTDFVDFNIGGEEENSDVNHAYGYGTSNSFSLESAGNLSHLDAGLTEEPVSIGDRVWIDENGNNIQDTGENGLDGVLVDLYTMNGAFITTDTTQTVDGESGMYLFERLESGDYYLEFNIPSEYSFVVANAGSDDALDSDVIEAIGPGTTNIISFGPGEVDLDIDAGVFLLGDINGLVWYDESRDGIRSESELFVEGAEVFLYDEFGVLIDSILTNAEGRYQFNEVGDGNFFLNFEIEEDYAYTKRNVGDDKYDSDVSALGNSPLLSSDDFPIEYLDAGIVTAGPLLEVHIWNDDNRNGLRDNNENPMEAIEIHVYDEINNLVTSGYTDANGSIKFLISDDGWYYIQIQSSDEYEFTIANEGDNDSFDSDVNDNGFSELFYSNENSSMLIEAGLIMKDINDNNNLVGFIKNKLNEEKIDIVIYPNPIENFCHVYIDSKIEIQSIKYELFDNNGRIVKSGMTTKRLINPEDKLLNIDVSTLFSGYYSLRIIANNQIIIKKMIIVND